MSGRAMPCLPPKGGWGRTPRKNILVRVALIDYGSGNLHSAEKSFAYAAARLATPPTINITSDIDEINSADMIVLPGVGAFGDCAAGLRGIVGLEEVLTARVLKGGVPFLGICVGMQLLFERGLEPFADAATTKGLGWLGGEVISLASNWETNSEAEQKTKNKTISQETRTNNWENDSEVEFGQEKKLNIPHMGWNDLVLAEGLEGASAELFAGVGGEDFYFIHSYVARPSDAGVIWASCDYGGAMVAAVGRDNFCGVQFHPEKSQAAGLRFIENFLNWRP